MFKGLLWVTVLLLHLHLSLQKMDFFELFCKSPIGPGYGALKNGGSACEINYKIKSNSHAKAEEFCSLSAPFSIMQVKLMGKTTVCLYARPDIECEGVEFPFQGKCYSVRGKGVFDGYAAACGSSSPTAIKNDEQLYWIRALFGEQYTDVWTTNTKNDVAGFEPITAKTSRRVLRKYGPSNEKEEDRPIKFRIKELSDGIMVGQPAYTHRMEQYAYLCAKRGNRR